MFTLTEEQTLLADAARGFVQNKMPVTALRAVRDAGLADGFDRTHWAEMAAMGWTGVIVPEAFGGAELGFVGLGLVLEEAGKTLAAAPLLSTAMIAASALLLGGSEAQKQHWLPQIAAGETIAALAVDEGPHHRPEALKATVTGGRLTGTKTYVADGHVADLLIVAALGEAGPGLFLVRADAEGVRRTRLTTIDSRGAADIAFDAAPAEALGDAGVLQAVLDRARIGLAAEMLGAAQQAFDVTADYLKTRTQFGQLIGAFQAMQHRAAKMLVELELTRSCVAAALSALDAGLAPAKIAEAASLAKARAGETLHLISNEMVQMHGGIGMTDAADPGLYLKRARVAEALYGSASYHRQRFAALSGF